MATTLAPVDSREVMRCDHCHLVQFFTSNHLCRRCHTSLDAPEPEPAPLAVITPEAAIGTSPDSELPHIEVASAIRTLRLRNGLSQRQLALRMQVPRTYVSKIENEKAMPTLSSLERLAMALQVRVPDLLNGGRRSRQDEILELMNDEFLAELVPYITKLNGLQLAGVLAQVRDMTVKPRRTS